MPAKGTVKFKLTKEVIDKAEAAAARGLDHVDIARVLGINPSTLYAHKAQNTEFEEAIRRGKAKGHLRISDAVFNRAAQGSEPHARLILRCRYGWKEESKVEHSGSVIQGTPQDFASLSDADLERIALKRGLVEP